MSDKTEVHKIEMMFVDHDELGADGARELFENARYPNHICGPQVVSVETKEVDWSDDHPLNHNDEWLDAYEKLFGGES